MTDLIYEFNCNTIGINTAFKIVTIVGNNRTI